jgi:hypothetical protein
MFLGMDMAVANLNIFAPEPEPDPVATELACRYMRLMSQRVRMHVSKPATKKWVHAFRMILKSFTAQEAELLITCLEQYMPKMNYTRPETLREQFGPLLAMAKQKAPHMFTELPGLPAGGKWQAWSVRFALEWPGGTTPSDAVVALRMQLHIFNVCHGQPCGWPLAAAWLSYKARKWQGWDGCPPLLSRCVYWLPDCKDADQLAGVIDPNVAKVIQSGNYTD